MDARKQFAIGVRALAVAALVFWFHQPFAAEPPYPQSSVINNIAWGSVKSSASGSDIWPNTFAKDGNIYSCWGDGTGFGGGKKVSWGCTRISGPPTSFGAKDIYRGPVGGNKGKISGLLSVNGTLYGWMNTQSPNWPNHPVKLVWSSDLGESWKTSSWVFEQGDGNLKPSAFLNFGKDYAGAPDDYVYFYGINQNSAGRTKDAYMGRVHKATIKDKNSYEYFAGLDSNKKPKWSSDINRRKPYFTDPNGGHGNPAVVYNAGIDRYLLTVGHARAAGQLGVFDAPNPWGPWTTVEYYDNWLGAGGGCGLNYGFANKWTSTDGKNMWMIFSCHCGCEKYHDKFNLVEATLDLKGSEPTIPPRPPSPPSDLKARIR